MTICITSSCYAKHKGHLAMCLVADYQFAEMCHIYS